MVKLLKPDHLQALLKTLLLKVTNAKNNHNGFPYQTGMNYLKGSFSFYGECVPGGLYFIEVKRIFDFLMYGVNIRIVRLDKMVCDPSLKIVKDSEKYRSNLIFLEDPMSLSDPATYEFLEGWGLSIEDNFSKILHHAIKHGFFSVISYLYEKVGALKMALPLTFAMRVYIIKKGNSEIYDYIASRHSESFKEFKVRVDDIPSEGRICTKIFSKNNASLIKRLMQEGVLIFSKSIDCSKALIKGNVELFLHFKGLGYDITTNLESNYEFMIKLVKKNDPAIFKNAGIDISKVESKTIAHCIMKSIKHGNKPMTEFLMKKFPNLASYKGAILCASVRKNDLEMVKRLGINRNVDHDLRKKIMKEAFKSYSYEVVEFLIDSYKKREGFLEEALWIVIDSGGTYDLNMIKLLMEKGVDYQRHSREIFKMIVKNPSSDNEFFSKYEGIITKEHFDKEYEYHDKHTKKLMDRKIKPFIGLH